MNITYMQFISVFNYGVIELAKNHIKSLRECGINNHCSYVTDEESLIELTALGYPVVYVKNTQTNKDNFNFGTMDFNNMSFLRYYIIYTLLEKGIDVWYLDVDTVVLKNLIPIYLDLKEKNNYDTWFQTDLNMPCTGCMLLFATEKTQNFVKTVIQNKTNQTNDQILVNAIIKQIPNIIKYEEFSHFNFPNGVMFFGNDFVNVPEYLVELKNEYMNSPKETYLVHANWMIGDETKKNAFKKYGLWRMA
jgi:hypothetical protein